MGEVVVLAKSLFEESAVHLRTHPQARLGSHVVAHEKDVDRPLGRLEHPLIVGEIVVGDMLENALGQGRLEHQVGQELLRTTQVHGWLELRRPIQAIPTIHHRAPCLRRRLTLGLHAFVVPVVLRRPTGIALDLLDRRRRLQR